MERETGFAPATSSLARKRSTPELLPQDERDLTNAREMRPGPYSVQGMLLVSPGWVLPREG